MNDYVKSQAKAAMPVTNDMILCKDCAHRNDKVPTVFCNVCRSWDNRKPNGVLKGGDCPSYKGK